MTPGTPHMTDWPAASDLTERGMAHFAGTEADGTTCGDYKFHGAKRHKGCAMFKRMTGKRGPAISEPLPSCKYFESKKAVP